MKVNYYYLKIKAISELGLNLMIMVKINNRERNPAILGKINIDSLFQDLKEQINVLGEINPEDSGIERFYLVLYVIIA